MAASIKQSVYDTEKVIEDKVRALPQNQGLNEYDMWVKIAAEIAQSKSDNKFVPNTLTQNKFGNK